MRKIIRREPPANDGDLPENINPVLRRVYAARGITTAKELAASFTHLTPFAALSGIDDAVALLCDALSRQLRMLVVADFDADGATSCATAVRALRLLGAKHVAYVVPNRFEYGYGLTPQIVEVAREYGPDLLITVDNGISSIEGVAAARRYGIKVLVTDHHLPGATLPCADAIVNPNQPGDEFPSKNLAGVGVIFYVMLALRARLRETSWFADNGIEVPNLANLVDIVALGTVADVVPLDHANRILVSQGLARIRGGRCCAGIKALLRVAERDPARVVAADLGFALGPRLNAAGRLEDMSLGIECLLTDDPAKALTIAQKLDALNKERREIENRMKQEAVDHLGELAAKGESNALPTGVCLFNEAWHQGVIGIVASRIKDQLHRPVIAFAKANDKELKGSARSVAGLHIRDVLDAVAAKHPDLLMKFGGHAMAAGLSIRPERFAEFSDAFGAEVARQIDEDQLQGIVYSDGELNHNDLTLELAEQLRNGGPWGQGFPEPVFDGIFEIVQHSVVGERHLKLRLKVPRVNLAIDAIAFNSVDQHWPLMSDRVEVAYRLDVNEFRGRRDAQLLVEYLAPVAAGDNRQ